ncbi:hypothetical protein Hypma_008362 [Hypsizygus marmoreus]|uniref:Uncharacterized protein n=1 Tax=Hypsizygus marmoreus TaxID=39966 RepID=A0A369JSJ8_HYPMA|nr:hypothetical protein Hypma_008362 [Hypsizygus marmoreus]
MSTPTPRFLISGGLCSCIYPSQWQIEASIRLDGSLDTTFKSSCRDVETRTHTFLMFQKQPDE